MRFLRFYATVNEVEIFAQMCKKNMIRKNISKYYEMYLEIMEIFGKLDKNIFGKLDKNIFGKLETYGIPNQHRYIPNFLHLRTFTLN